MQKITNNLDRQITFTYNYQRKSFKHGKTRIDSDIYLQNKPRRDW